MRSSNPKFISILLVFCLIWLIIRFFLPLFSPFLLGTLLALSAEPMVRFLQTKLHVPRSVSSGIGVSMAFSLLAILLLCLCAFLIRELSRLGHVLPASTVCPVTTATCASCLPRVSDAFPPVIWRA